MLPDAFRARLALSRPPRFLLLFLVALIPLLLLLWRTSFSSSSQPPTPALDALPSGPMVELGYASYRGMTQGDQHVFLGMRYARPPIGEGRWRAPGYPPPLEPGVQDASEFGYSCHDSRESTVTLGRSEDCLFINVWSPAALSPGERLPVLFWIHGGGYVAGMSNYYPGTHLVKASGNKILFVSINYRLAQFGFLASREMEEDGELNVGLLDQYAALMWVRDYVEAFGGDPEQVTIWGESAGAGSVAMQLMAYGGTSILFRAAVANSVFFPFQPKLSDVHVEEQFRRFATLAGCANATMSCLRSRDEKALVAAGRSVAKENPSLFAYTPVVDGVFVQDYPVEAFLAGRVKKVPMITGYNTNEGTSFAHAFLSSSSSSSSSHSQPPTLSQYLLHQFPTLTLSTLHEILALYPREAHTASLAYNGSTEWGRAAAVYGEAVFVCAGAVVGAGEGNYAYRFNRTATDRPEGYGTPHGAELPFFFGPPTHPHDLTSSMQAYLTSFVRTSDPNAYKLPDDVAWPMAGEEGRRQLRFEEGDTGAEDMPSDLRERCRFWWGKAGEMQV